MHLTVFTVFNSRIYVTDDATSADTDGAYTDISATTCVNTARIWKKYIYQAGVTISGSTDALKLQACKKLCNADANCQLLALISTTCYLGRFDYTGTAISITSTSAPKISILKSKYEFSSKIKFNF